VYRIYSELELNVSIGPRKRLFKGKARIRTIISAHIYCPVVDGIPPRKLV